MVLTEQSVQRNSTPVAKNQDLQDLERKNLGPEENVYEMKELENQNIELMGQNQISKEENIKLQNSTEDANAIKTENDDLEKQLEVMPIKNKDAKDDYETNNSNGFIQMLAIKSEERDAFAAECSQLRKEVEDIKVNIEHFAENVTGFSLKGKAIAEMIDFVKSRYFEGREHRKGSGIELEQGGEQKSRSHCYMFESRKSPDGTANDLQSEVKQNRKKINDLAMENDELYSLNEKLVRENTEFQQIRKNLQEDIESMEISRAKDMEHIAKCEAQLKKLSTVDSRMLQERLNNLTNVCAGLKKNIEITGQELSQWDDIGQLIDANFEEEQEREVKIALDKESIKEKLITLFDEHKRLKITENLISQQSLENEDIRDRLAAVIGKNNELNKQLSNMALKERQFHERKVKLSKACSERNALQHDVQELTEKLAQYDEYYKNYNEIMDGYEHFRVQYESAYADKSKLQKLLEEHIEMLKILQNENIMLHNKITNFYEVERREDQRNSETDCLKKETADFEKFVQEHDEEKRTLEEEIKELKHEIQNKEYEILEAHEKNSEMKAKLSNSVSGVDEEIDKLKKEMEALRSENELSQSISSEQRDIISNLHVEKAELATEIDTLRSKLGTLENIQQAHDQQMKELETYKKNCFDMESRYNQARDLAAFYTTSYEKTEAELVEVNNLVDILKKENVQLIGDCASSHSSLRRRQKWLEEKVMLEENAKRLKAEVYALNTELQSASCGEIDQISRRLLKSKYSEDFYTSKYLDIDEICPQHDRDSANMKADIREIREELIGMKIVNSRLQLETAQMKLNFEALQGEKGLENLENMNIKGATSRSDSELDRSFQGRLDDLSNSNAKLISEKQEMEHYLDEIVADSKSLNAQILEVGYSTGVKYLEFYIYKNLQFSRDVRKKRSYDSEKSIHYVWKRMDIIFSMLTMKCTYSSKNCF